MLVENAHYPTPAIGENSRKLRPLGLGYANLGALLMASGLPYDSDEGRAYAASITSLMTGEAYLQSSKIADEVGPFSEYPRNRDAFLEVIGMHRDAAYQVPNHNQAMSPDLARAHKAVWDTALESGKQSGYKNGQVTVLAPTGTIGFMMDCDTTGVEPDLALVKYKKLVGGGTIKIVNQTVPLALRRLNYSEEEINAIVDYVDERGTIEGAPAFKEEHLTVFDGMRVHGQNLLHHTVELGLDFIHDLHRLDDAKYLTFRDPVADRQIRLRTRLRSTVVGAYHGRLHLEVRRFRGVRPCRRLIPRRTFSGRRPRDRRHHRRHLHR